MALGATILTCRNRYVNDLERGGGFIWQESAQNRSLDNKKSTLSEPKILSRIWEACRAALAMSVGSHYCSSRSDFQRPIFQSFGWVGLLGSVLECGAIFGGYFFKLEAIFWRWYCYAMKLHIEQLEGVWATPVTILWTCDPRGHFNLCAGCTIDSHHHLNCN